MINQPTRIKAWSLMLLGIAAVTCNLTVMVPVARRNIMLGPSMQHGHLPIVLSVGLAIVLFVVGVMLFRIGRRSLKR